jgi:hypothetical protein
MAGPGRQTFEKRQREKKKQDKRQGKIEKRNLRKEEKDNGSVLQNDIVNVSDIVTLPAIDED